MTRCDQYLIFIESHTIHLDSNSAHSGVLTCEVHSGMHVHMYAGNKKKM